MELKTWLAFAALETVLCFAPGPAVLTVFACALDAGWRGGLASTFGILAGNALYFMISAAGLGAVLLASPGVFVGLQWAGAAYLVWVGLGMLLGGRRSERAPGAPIPRATTRYFTRALMVQVTNPKALIFFGALLPQFMDAERSPIVQFWILGLTGGIVELLVLAFYTGVAVTGQRRFPAGSFATIARRVAGAWIAVLGAALAIARIR